MALGLGVIGAGAMGALHARVISEAPGVELRWVADPDEATRTSVGARYGAEPRVTPGTLDDIDAVLVAAPTEAHARWCFEAIDAGVPFLVEKPLSTDLGEVEQVVAAARASGVPFTVGFVERFNPAVRTVEGIIDTPIYFNATRHSPYVDRIRSGVGGDLMIHDIDLALRLVHSRPISVVASLAFVHPSSDATAEDIAEAHIQFDDGAVASLSASRTAQRKIRTLTVADLEMTAEVDLMRQDVTIFRHVLSAAIREDRPGYRQETVMEIPQLRYRDEPLVAQLAHFVDLVGGEIDPEHEAAAALQPHRLLAAAHRSVNEGSTIRVDDT